MVRRKKTTGRPGSSHNKKNGGGLKLVVAVLALVMVIGIFFAAHKAPGGENKSFSDIVSEIMPKKAALDKTKQTEVNSQEKAMNPKMDLGEEDVADKQTETKKTKEAGADKEAAKAALTVAISTIESASSKGVYHKNNAGRKVSRLTKLVNTLA